MVALAAPAIVLADGRTDFNGNCAACHGANANLLPRTARIVKASPQKLALKASKMDKDEMMAITEKGRDKMPGFEKQLTREQITAIVDFIMSVKIRPKQP